MNRQGLFWPSGRHLFKRRTAPATRLAWAVAIVAAALLIAWATLA